MPARPVRAGNTEDAPKRRGVACPLGIPGHLGIPGFGRVSPRVCAA
jgi:hypothetical protein